jgi:DNA-binding transcriptional MerR regulator
MPDKYMTTAEVAAFSGATLRQLQWWDERGILRPERIELHSRLYTQEAAARARKLAILRAAGASLQEIRRYKLLEKGFESATRVDKPTLIAGVMVIPFGRCKRQALKRAGGAASYQHPNLRRLAAENAEARAREKRLADSRMR